MSCVLGLALSLGACSAEIHEQKAPVRVTVQTVKAQDVAAQVVLSGDIQARKVTEQAFRVPGKLVKRWVDVGDRVKAGQVLARLDPREQRTDLESAKADVAVRESRLQLAEQNYQRQQRLLPKGYTNLSEYQQAESALQSARSDLASFKARHANAREQVGYTELVAVADGVMTARHAEEGQVVQAGTPIFSLAHDGEREAVFAVYESLPGNDRIGDAVPVSPVGQPEAELIGRIREITPIVSTANGTLRIRVALPDTPAVPVLGTVVSARLDTLSQRAFVLPWSALTRTRGRPAVWRVDGQSKVALSNVQVLRYEAGQVLVTEGLSDGDRVVAQGLQFLYAGQQVEVVEPRTPQRAVSMASLEQGQ